jgi:SAM-dependent methyltransferase
MRIKRLLVCGATTVSAWGAKGQRGQVVRQVGNLGDLRMALNSPVSTLFDKVVFPETWPFSPADFKRLDESSDSIFYSSERFVTHIDDNAINALTKYYSTAIKPDSSVLDICSSWVSHYPKGLKLGRVAGLGMNLKELQANKQLTEYAAKDLNVDPIFPYADNSFDYVTCVVSVDYLTRPLEVFSEINRVLKPGGTAIFSQSNRCFQTKAIDIWLKTNDLQHLFIIGCYFHYSGKYTRPKAIDISPGPFSDPMFIVEASKVK